MQQSKTYNKGMSLEDFAPGSTEYAKIIDADRSSECFWNRWQAFKENERRYISFLTPIVRPLGR